jgi:PAS domain-containing protein
MAHEGMRKSAHQLSTRIDKIQFLAGLDGTGDRTDVAELLPASDPRSHQIIDSIPALIAIMNAAGELELVNRQVLEYFGKTLEELKSWRPATPFTRMTVHA